MGTMEPYIEPLLPPVAPSSPAATPAAPAAPSAAARAAATPADRAGESTPTSGLTTSSRPVRGRRLAGVVAASVLSAAVASVATVGGLVGMGVIDRGAPASSAAVTSATTDPTDASVTITANDAVVAVAESASPAVVTLTVESAGDGAFGPFSMPSTGVGSGFVFDADGLILTNEHVVEGDGTITVAFQDGTELPGTVIATDTQHDLAVVRVEASGLPTVEIGRSATLKVGQLVVAIGSPLGTFTESVTSGILSATGRTIEVGSQSSRRTTTMTGLLQTDAAINSGNSGGPLLDASGRVIGVNVAVATSAQGIGFAVPIEAASDIIAEARAATGAA
jgi:putative serine protease PepD